MRKYNNIFLIVVSILVSVWSCRPEPKETPTKGYLKCLADESLFNVVKEERDKFTELYKESKIDLAEVKAREGIASVLNGEAKLFVSSRNLNQEEKEFLAKNKTSKEYIKIFKFCYDGIALIVNDFEPVNQIKLTEFKDLLLGAKKNFKIILPEPNSGIYEYVKNDLLQGKDPKDVQIVNSEQEVIDRVRNTKNVIGVVALSVLNDKKNLKVMKVSIGENVMVGDDYYEPIPGYLVNGSYPMVRTAYILVNEIGLYVASGFATFLTSTEGQKIVLKNNLGPATVPVKLVHSY